MSTAALHDVLRDHTLADGLCRVCGPALDGSTPDECCRFRARALQALRRRQELWIGGDGTPPAAGNPSTPSAQSALSSTLRHR